MPTTTSHHELCRHFATLLSYPDGDVRQTAAGCAAQLRELDSAAADPMAEFAAFLAVHQSSRLEELFTATFDLQPVCHPYVGYQLCGESQQRTMFLIRLQQLYRQHGFSGGCELPDHLATLLRFVGTIADQECRLEIVRDGLLPALTKILAGLEGKSSPYAELLDALQRFLTETVDAGTELSAVNGRRS